MSNEQARFGDSVEATVIRGAGQTEIFGLEGTYTHS